MAAQRGLSRIPRGIGDALGVLHGARKFVHATKYHGRDGFVQSSEGARGASRALWTQRNSTGDMLSRFAEGHEVPQELNQSMRTQRKPVVRV